MVFSQFQQLVLEDISAGLFPSVVWASVLAGGPQAILDPLRELSVFCSQTGMWLHLEMSPALGSSERHGTFMEQHNHFREHTMKAKSATSSSPETALPLSSFVMALRAGFEEACAAALSRADSFHLPLHATGGKNVHSLLEEVFGSEAATTLLSNDLSLLALADMRKLQYVLEREWNAPFAFSSTAASQSTSGGNGLPSSVLGAYDNAIPDTPFLLGSVHSCYKKCNSAPLSLPLLRALGCLALIRHQEAVLVSSLSHSESTRANWRCPPLADVASSSTSFLLEIAARMTEDGRLEILSHCLLVGCLVCRWRLEDDEATAVLCRVVQQVAHAAEPPDLSGEGRASEDCKEVDPSGLLFQCSLVQIKRRCWMMLTSSASRSLCASSSQDLELTWAILKKAMDVASPCHPIGPGV